MIIRAPVAQFGGKGHSLGCQPLDRVPAVFYSKTHRLGIAQSGAGNQGVLNMGFDGVGLVQYRRHPSLGIEGATLG